LAWNGSYSTTSAVVQALSQPTAGGLYTEPVVRFFQHHEADAFDKALHAVDRATSVVNVSDINELLLSPTGQTLVGNRRYTAEGFMHIARTLSSGLWTLLVDISGGRRRPLVDPDSYDAVAAINIFNATLRLRFSQLDGKRLILTPQRIEGLGPSYCYMDNRTLFQAAQETIELSPVPTLFLGASLIGRRMNIWYRSREPMFSVPVGGKRRHFWTGYYIANGEVTGVSLRGAEAIYNSFGNCLGSLTEQGQRVIHAGTTFTQRVERMLSRLISREPDVERLRERFVQLAATSLNLVGSEEVRQQREARILQILGRRSLPRSIAGDVLSNAICVGSDTTLRPSHVMLTAETAAARTAYDLFCGLVRVGKKVGLDRREKLEQIAYELLLGKLKL
jgi:hypothetical protein